jgi:hypothetical protein
MFSDFATLSMPCYPRAEIRAQLVNMRAANNSPMPDAAIDEIVDLACHAAQSGRQAMLQVIDRASDYRVSVTAVGIASSLMAHDMKLLIEGLQHAAQHVGLHFESTTISAGGQAHG